jgi:hypothetical protein
MWWQQQQNHRDEVVRRIQAVCASWYDGTKSSFPDRVDRLGFFTDTVETQEVTGTADQVDDDDGSGKANRQFVSAGFSR